jgi:hypothetical protein
MPPTPEEARWWALTELSEQDRGRVEAAYCGWPLLFVWWPLDGEGSKDCRSEAPTG